jgi:hypothetical protein
MTELQTSDANAMTALSKFTDPLNGGVYMFEYYTCTPDRCVQSIRANRIFCAQMMALIAGYSAVIWPVAPIGLCGIIYFGVTTRRENNRIRKALAALAAHAADGEYPTKKQ